jgi:hypothetical protein
VEGWSGGRAVGRSGGRAVGRSGGRAVGRSGRYREEKIPFSLPKIKPQFFTTYKSFFNKFSTKVKFCSMVVFTAMTVLTDVTSCGLIEERNTPTLRMVC